MSTNIANNEKPKGRRSSLKSNNNKLDSTELMKQKNKRNSVSWGLTNTFKFKAMKAMFQESNDINKPRKYTTDEHKLFVENRKKSIKDEFSIVKEMMKKDKNLMEEVEIDDDEVKKNTEKNLKMAKESLSIESESSDSSESESEEEKK